MLDLRLINGTVVGPELVELRDIGIEDGRIVEISAPGGLGPAQREIDATGLHVLPGVIDIHFHCRAPNDHPERGDFASETAAAVSGGVTTVFEMPIAQPGCSTPEVFALRRALIERDAYANVALYSGAIPPHGVQGMVEAGAIGFKLFTISPAAGREAEFDGLWATDEGEIHRALEATADTGLRCVVHAENEALVHYFERRDPLSRPPVTEAVEILTLAAIARDTGAPIHVAHVSSALGLDALRSASALGAPITAETCPQYLLLDQGTVATYGGIARIGPPLRTPTDAEALWAGLRDGTLSALASDHSPFLKREKDVPYGSAPSGLPTVEVLLPLALDAVARGVLTLPQVVELLAAGPARMFGLAAHKGAIELGADADLAVVSLHDTFAPGPGTLRSRAADCAVVYGGITLRGAVRATIVGGAAAFENGVIHSEPTGRFIAGAGVGAVASG